MGDWVRLSANIPNSASTSVDVLAPGSLVHKVIRTIDCETFEILWSYIATHYDDARVHNEAIDGKIAFALGALPPHVQGAVSPLDYAIRLMEIYEESDAEIKVQYEETLKSVALGIYKYAIDNEVLKLSMASHGDRGVGEIINEKLSSLSNFKLSLDSLGAFLNIV